MTRKEKKDYCESRQSCDECNYCRSEQNGDCIEERCTCEFDVDDENDKTGTPYRVNAKSTDK